MKNFKKIVILIFTSFVLTNCGFNLLGSGSHDSGQTTVTSPPTYSSDPTSNPSPQDKDKSQEEHFTWNKYVSDAYSSYENYELEASFRQALYQYVPAECGENVACHRGVGTLLSASLDRHVAGCTVFLVETDVIMTDSHCIPDDLKFPGSRGQGRMAVSFPFSNEWIEVDHTIFASDLANAKFSQDYALLKLTRWPSESPVKFSRSGFKDGSQVTIWKTLPSKRSPLTKATCHVKQNLPLFPGFDNDQSPIVSLENCPVEHGNSGAPIFNERDEVIGLVQAFLNSDKTNIGSLMNPEDVAGLPEYTLATNVSCIQDFSNPTTQLAEACKEDMSYKKYVEIFAKRFHQEESKVGDDIEKQVKIKMQDWTKKNSKIFRWKFSVLGTPTQHNSHAGQIPQLDCIHPVSQWIEDYKTLGFNNSEATVTGGYYSFQASVGADKNMNLHPDARVWPMGTYEIKFSPSEVASKGVAHLTFANRMQIFGKEIAIPMPMTIRLCK